MKKMLLSKILKEDDVFKVNPNIKQSLSNLDKLIKDVQQQIKSDAYDQAIQTLASVASVAQQTQWQLSSALQSNPEVKKLGIQAPTNNNDISNTEI